MTIIVANTKGGAGKSVIATQVIPTLFIDQNKKIKIYELDNNNQTKLSNSALDFRTIRASESEDAVFDVSFDHMDEESNVVNIIDAGGGDDTLQVLNAIRDAEIRDAIYIIPINDDIEQIENALQTIDAIKEIDANAKINLVLNRATVNSRDPLRGIQEQFIGLFGSDEYGIGSREEDFTGVNLFYVPNSPIFGILKNIYQTTLVDVYPNFKDIIENKEKYMKEWRSEGKEVFKQNLKRKRLAEDVLDLIESFGPMKAIVGGESNG